MNISIDANLFESLTQALQQATTELASSRHLIQNLNENRLLTEVEAQAYLKRDADTLRYYRTLGLDSFKKGKDRWYAKSDIDAWLESGKVSRHKR